MRSIEDFIMMNLMELGFVDREDMAKVETINKNYTIQLTKKDYHFDSYKFLCKFDVYNILQVKIFELLLDENRLIKLCNGFYDYYNDDRYSLLIELDSETQFYLCRNENGNIDLKIFHKGLYRLNLEMDESILCKFVNISMFLFFVQTQILHKIVVN